MWALGVMLFKATFGVDSEPVALGGQSVPVPEREGDINVRLRELLQGLLKVDPATRLTAPQALWHPYFTVSFAEEIHSQGNLIRTSEKLSMFRSHLRTVSRSDAVQFLRIRREAVVHDVLSAFSRFGRSNLRRRLVVAYEGEAGVDAGGITKDMLYRFFSSLMLDDPSLTGADQGGSTAGEALGGRLFERAGTSGPETMHQPCFLPRASCELLTLFEALGKLMAKVLLDEHTVELPFSPYLYKYLLGQEPHFKDLEAYDADLYDQLRRNVLERDITQEYAADTLLDFEGLCDENGARMARAVTNANKREYLDLLASDKILNGRRRQLEALRRGFDTLDFRSHMSRFNAVDLRVLLGGPTDLDADMVIENIDFKTGNWRRSRTPAFLQQILAGWNSTRLRMFLKFVTGSPCLPYGGLHKLRSNQIGSTKTKITLTRLPKSDRLPEVRVGPQPLAVNTQQYVCLPSHISLLSHSFRL